jgi:hypothetical protein
MAVLPPPATLCCDEPSCRREGVAVNYQTTFAVLRTQLTIAAIGVAFLLTVAALSGEWRQFPRVFDQGSAPASRSTSPRTPPTQQVAAFDDHDGSTVSHTSMRTDADELLAGVTLTDIIRAMGESGIAR